MPNPQSGFQLNTTISNAFWRYVPNTSTGRVVYVALDGIQFIEATPDGSKCWLYYAANSVSTSQVPYILEGDVSQAFLADLGGLF
jgi:hypothetical protein